MSGKYKLRNTRTGKQSLVFFKTQFIGPDYANVRSLDEWGIQTGGEQDIEDLRNSRLNTFPAVVIDDGGQDLPYAGFCVYDGQSHGIKIGVRDAASIRTEIIKSDPNRIQRKGEKNV